MRYIYIIILSIAACLPSLSLSAQEPTVEASTDAAAILIGEQAHLTTRVACRKDAKVKFPDFRRGYIAEGVEMLEAGKIDTFMTDGGRRMELTRVYTLTAFDSAFYTIPPIEVEVDGKIYQSKHEIGLKVNTVEVDEQHPDDLRPLKAPVDNAFIWSPRLVGLCLLMWGVLLLSAVLFVRLCIAKPATKRIKVTPPTPPQTLAIEAIEQLRQSDKEGEHIKAYYTQLTDVLRTYIFGRFGFNAHELTTHEIISRLQHSGDTEGIDGLRNILTTADLVKFAKYETTLAESERSLLQAVAYINSTHDIETENAKPVEQTVVIADAGQRRRRMMLRGGIILSFGTGLLLMGYIGYEVWLNFC